MIFGDESEKEEKKLVFVGRWGGWTFFQKKIFLKKNQTRNKATQKQYDAQYVSSIALLRARSHCSNKSSSNNNNKNEHLY